MIVARHFIGWRCQAKRSGEDKSNLRTSTHSNQSLGFSLKVEYRPAFRSQR
jgi:hypothetical protein